MNSFLNKFATFSAIILILLVIGSCDSLLNQDSSLDNKIQSTTSQVNAAHLKESQSLNHDEQMMRLAKDIPGLGGLFLNDSGQLSIYLTHPTKQRAQASAILSSFKPLTNTLDNLRAMGQKYATASISSMEAITGEYTFIQLYEWKNKVTTNVLPVEGVYSNGIDESRNRLSIGVKGTAIRAKVNEKLVQLNIPKEAVTIFEMSEPSLLTSLRDGVSSYSGGIKITIDSGGWCSMGPTVRWRESSGGPYVTGFITASHCTPPLGGGVNGTQFYQPVSGGNYAGIETRDPLFSGNKCWNTGQNCRESDAALISYSGTTPDLVPGSIFKTTSKDRNSGSIQIPSYNQRFYIKGIDNFIPEGVETHKIGARTGWTYGNGTEICQDFTVGNLTYVCQNLVQAGADNGDSGAPVFATTASSDSVIFYGTLSGGYSSGGDPYYWYSSVTRIKNELSGSNVYDLTFTAPPPPLSVSMSGTFYITQDGNYTWEANPKHGNGTYSYQWQYGESYGGPWSTVASTKTYTRYVVKQPQQEQFYLRVKVTSGSENASSIRQVTVTSSDCPPNQICP